MKGSCPFDTQAEHQLLRVLVPLYPPAVRDQQHDKIQRPGYQTSRRAEIFYSLDPLPS